MATDPTKIKQVRIIFPDGLPRGLDPSQHVQLVVSNPKRRLSDGPERKDDGPANTQPTSAAPPGQDEPETVAAGACPATPLPAQDEPEPSGKSRAEGRENGRKSRGPITPEGKARSSQNALKHGLSSRRIVIGTEDEEKWLEFRDECRETLQPVGAIELGYADEFAASRWRLQRCLGIETSIFDYQFAMQKIYDVEKCATMDGVDRTGMAFKSAKDDLTALGRFETRIRRSGERAFANLLKYQSMRQNEPSKADARVREPAPQPVQPGESSAAVPQNKPEIPPAPADPTGPPTTQAPAGDVLQNKSKQPAAPDVFTESTMAQALPATVNPQNESNEGAPSLNPQAP